MPKKAAKALTVRAIEALRPRDTTYSTPDGVVPGLAVLTHPTGRKVFRLSARLSDPHTGERKLRHVTLAEFISRQPESPLTDRLTLSEARTKAAEIIAGGIVPEQAGKMRRGTFGAIAAKYIQREIPKLARGAEIQRVIERKLLPAWRARPWETLRRADAYDLLDQLVDDGKPAAALKLHEIIRRLGRWAVRRDLAEVNPFAELEAPTRKVRRDRVLDDEEIRLLWSAWARIGYPGGDLQRLLLVTGARLREAAEATWDELDLDRRIWTIPASRTKSDRVTEVPLSTLALEIIGDIPRFRAGPYVFTTTSGRRPISGFSKMKSRADRVALDISREQAAERGEDPEAVRPIPPWRLHDLRRTVRTNLSKLGVSDTVAEKVLGHGPRDVLKAIYDRHAYAGEKAEALERWSVHLRGILEPQPDKVVKIRP